MKLELHALTCISSSGELGSSDRSELRLPLICVKADGINNPKLQVPFPRGERDDYYFLFARTIGFPVFARSRFSPSASTLRD